MNPAHANWKWFTFSELTAGELYDILALRQEVFVVEQRCAFLDADGLDEQSLHLCGRDARGVLTAYLRLVPPGFRFADPSIGRVVTARSIRRTGLGHSLMKEGIRKAEIMYPGLNIRVSAQTYLRDFYKALGFADSSEIYDEDGIPHVEMVRHSIIKKTFPG